MDINPHPHIKPDEFELLLKIHNAVDSILSLHYSNHSQFITAHQLFEKLQHLLNRGVKLDNFLCLFLIDPFCFKLTTPIGVKDLSPCRISLFQPIHQFNLTLQSRKGQFIEDINLWIKNNPDQTSFEYPELEDVIYNHKQSSPCTKPPNSTKSPNKVTKPKLALKNSSSKFMFKPKDELKQQANNNGLSLLERIKLKEAKLKQQADKETPEMKHNKFLEDKIPQIYNILAQINGETPSTKTYPLSRLTQLIKDSLNYPIHNEEILDCLKLIQTKLSQQVLSITTRNELSVVKVYRLNRSRDLQALGRTDLV